MGIVYDFVKLYTCLKIVKDIYNRNKHKLCIIINL